MTCESYSRHTPGPWEILVNEDSPNGLIWSPGRETDVCELNGNRQTAFEIMANARLIASAPALLAALEDMLDLTVNRQGGMWTQEQIATACKFARAAIAKAKGD
jgi:hypothetical protein